MNISKDRQGHLEDLNEMTLPQLNELLERQEKILCKKKFLATLPDKGEKSRTFAEMLRKLITERSNIESNNGLDSTNQIYHRLHDDSSHGFKSQEMSESDIMEGSEEKTIKSLLTRNEDNVTFCSDSRKSGNRDLSSMDGVDSDDLTRRLQELSVGTEHSGTQQAVTNSYERVIKKVETDPSTLHSKFLPHRTKKEKSSILFTSNQEKSVNKVKEESAVCPPPYSHESTKLISIEESVQLVQDQKIRAEQHAAERAAQKLAEQFTPKMKTYEPSSADMRYRQTEVEDEQDSDDFASDEDNDAGL